VGHVAAVDDQRLVAQTQGRDRGPHLLASARRGDRPPNAQSVEELEHVAGAWQRLRVAVELVVELACVAVELFDGSVIEHAAVVGGDLPREAAPVGSDQWRQLVPIDLDRCRGECGDPGRDADRHRVHERAVQVEDEGTRRRERGHRRYDTRQMPSELARFWTLDPAVTFLNHGAYGATPRPVLDAQSAWRERIEREPVAFFARDFEPALDRARDRLGRFVGADPDDLAFVHNASAGVMTVLRSVPLATGDELLVTDHAYNAARNALDFVAARAGARIVEVTVPFPDTDADAVVEALLARVSPRTRLALVDHITSPTALVLPIARIVGTLAERGVDTLVDGAHAPGMEPIDLEAIGAAYYTGNCHKWLSAPKGSAFLHVRRGRQAPIRPLTISHGANSLRTDRPAFRLEFDWTGTDDPSAFLAVPDAIRFGEELVAGGWPALRARNRALARYARDRLCAELGVSAPAPDAMIGSMVAIPVTVEEAREPVPLGTYDDPLHAHLVERGLQVAVIPWPPRPSGEWRRLIRVSLAPYNDRDDVEALAGALGTLHAARA
jgi:isopenicillin-N epimerase